MPLFKNLIEEGRFPASLQLFFQKEDKKHSEVNYLHSDQRAPTENGNTKKRDLCLFEPPFHITGEIQKKFPLKRPLLREGGELS